MRRDRFYYAIPGVTEQQFETSNFLKYYRRTSKNPTDEKVISSLLQLTSISNRAHPVCKSVDEEESSHNAIKAYTSDHYYDQRKFYRYVNEQIVNDDPSRLKKLMPFIRKATHQINYHGSNEKYVVYRGMELDENQRRFFKRGKVFRFPGFTSTTEIRHVARQFGNTYFKIYVYEGCPHVKNVANDSYFPQEAEWLFVPYSRFMVLEREDHRIVLQSLDNAVESETSHKTSKAIHQSHTSSTEALYGSVD